MARNNSSTKEHSEIKKNPMISIPKQAASVEKTI